MLRRLLKRADWLFLALATPVGIVLCLLIPPLGGGNEMYNFQRIAGVAYGEPGVGPVTLPGGIVAFVNEGFRYFHEGLATPFGFGAEEYHRLAAILLDAHAPAVLPSNPIAVHNPVAYLPQAAVLRFAALAGASPLTLFILARLAGLAAALALTFAAIRLMPSHKVALAALALLPPIVFGRSAVDADPVTNGFAFLFIAAVLRESVCEEAMTARSLAGLVALAFVMGQCKSAYFVLLPLALLIPRRRFASPTQHGAALALLILPGVLASLAWMAFAKASALSSGAYHTWSGMADPDRQLAFVFAHPIGYVETFIRTLFATDFFLRSLVQVFGAFGPPVYLPLPVIAILFALFLGAVFADGAAKAPEYPRRLFPLALAIFAVFLALSLTLLYLQWTGYAKPVIEGFQGRYLYPLLPLFVVLPRLSRRPFGLAPETWLLAQVGIGLPAMLAETAWAYYG